MGFTSKSDGYLPVLGAPLCWGDGVTREDAQAIEEAAAEEEERAQLASDHYLRVQGTANFPHHDPDVLIQSFVVCVIHVYVYNTCMSVS
jgi:hypothetical protein